LYLANVLGAMCGTFLTAVVFVEIWGFHHTLWQAAVGNFTVAFVSVCLGLERRSAPSPSEKPPAPADLPLPQLLDRRMAKIILFSTGFVAMAMEVVWTRAFTPVLKTQVYSFAMIVFTYLGATFFGSWMYRVNLRKNRLQPLGKLIGALAVTAFLPVMVNDSRWVVAQFWLPSLNPTGAIILLGSICPFCALLGYLTPRLVDGYASGNPAGAGSAYAINVLGCILGPLFACYVLLPQMSERHALILLALPFLVFWLCFFKSQTRRQRLSMGLAIGAVLVWSSQFTEDFETMLFKTMKHTTVRRDYAASVISFGEGWNSWLLVNGIGMTKLTPITKFIAHLTLAFHKGPPESALVICFGMGTTYRSAMSWDIDTTAVELVPGVTQAFGFYHADAARLANNPKGHIIIDDGRRYLKRTAKKFDVIVVDPPPPVQTAGSSLLFSREFYELARQHLKPGGILQMWFSGDNEIATDQAVFRSIYESFPYVRCFSSVDGWGMHILASMEPIEQLDADRLAARMPESARQDLLEWNASKDAPAYLGQILTNEYSLPTLLNPDVKIQVTDDEPFNEYFLLRRLHR
jgi:spermidine synthase